VIVSALVLQNDGNTTHGVETYLSRFDHLVRLELPIVFYLDRAITPPTYPWWVKVIPVRLKELDTYKLLSSKEDIQLPTSRNVQKDTFDFLALMNAKAEFVHRAMALCESHRLTWLDCGVSHVLKDLDSLKCLNDLYRLPEGIIIPGPREKGIVSPSSIHWRFCGGLVSGDRNSWNTFYATCNQVMLSLLPKVTWEVNIWALLEQQGFPIRWFYGDHNDSMLNFKSVFSETPCANI
jgi:hypothetical protein